MQTKNNSSLLQSFISIKNDMKLIELAKSKFEKANVGQTIANSVSQTDRTSPVMSPKK